LKLLGALTFTAEHTPACYYHKYALFSIIIRKLAKNKNKKPPKKYIIIIIIIKKKNQLISNHKCKIKFLKYFAFFLKRFN